MKEIGTGSLPAPIPPTVPFSGSIVVKASQLLTQPHQASFRPCVINKV